MSNGRLQRVNSLKHCKNLAELVGIILGDGSIYVKEEVGAYQIRIAFSLKDEKEYRNYVNSLSYEIFGIKPGIKRHRNSAYYVCINSKQAVQQLRGIGLKEGNKKRNRSTIPDWVKKNKEYLKACTRGLIDTDGSIYRLSSKDPKTLRISFKNRNTRLLNDARLSLESLGFHPSKIIEYNIFLTRKEDTKKYLNEIGFNNSKHIKKLKKLAP